MTINIASEIAFEKVSTIQAFDILIQVDEPVLHIPESSFVRSFVAFALMFYTKYLYCTGV